MSIVDGLLFDAGPAAIYRTAPLADAGLRDARSAVQGRGWDVAVIDGTQAASKAELLDRFAEEFHFPEGFGANWDALSDSLRDLSWSPAESRVVIWSSPETLFGRDPDAGAVALEILDETVAWWSDRGSHFSVVLATDPAEHRELLALPPLP